MTSKNGMAGVIRYASSLSLAALLSLSLLQCSAEQPASEAELDSVRSAVITNPHCGSIACSSVADCMTVANWPLCAKIASAVCHSVSHECTYQLKNDVACQCLERDVRHCNINATTGGVQICVANAGRTATYWDTCQATPVCVP